MSLESQIQDLFGLSNPRLEHLNTLVNDVALVTASSGKFALKLYNGQARTINDIQWEIDLVQHLVAHGAPVMRPVRGRHGYVEMVTVAGQVRAAAVSEWVPGEKPKPSRETYVLLGGAAARIHQAADAFEPPWTRFAYDARELIDEQTERMKRHLMAVRRYGEVVALGARLKDRIGDPVLDKGICHMDLTLDNVHVHDGKLTAFDFDSAGHCWRAFEPYGVLRFSEDYFRDWLEGYRSIRPFSEADEKAVCAFAIIADMENVVWKLGEARTSRGKPLMTDKDLPETVAGWLDWEREKIGLPSGG